MIPLGFCLVTFGVSYAELRYAAQQIEALGFDSIWVWDHYVSWNDPYQPVLEAWTTLTALATATQRIRLGPLVANNTNRHPGRLAKVAATLQEIAGGRLEVGIGAGGLAFEQEQFGISQGNASQRVAALAEALQIIAALWSGAPVTFQGDYYQLTGAIVAPPPAPRPPLIVGAHTPRTVRVAGRYADGLNLQWRDRERFPQLFAALDAALAERGRGRSGFDLSLHPGWRDLAPDPLEALAHWEQLGFTRAIVYIHPPYPLDALAALARRLGV